MEFYHFVPLLRFVVPTVVIGYGSMTPRSRFAGVTFGFVGSIVGACVSYWLGIRALVCKRHYS